MAEIDSPYPALPLPLHEDQSSLRDLLSSREWILEGLQISPMLREKLIQDLVSVPGIRSPLQLRFPEEIDQFDCYNYFAVVCREFSPLSPGEAASLRHRLVESKQSNHLGSIHWNNNSVEITEGVRGSTPYTLKQIFELILYRQEMSHEWCGDPPLKALWGTSVLPAIKHIPRNDPFHWAKACLEIAGGYAATMIGRNVPWQYLEDVIGDVAQTVCNPAPTKPLKNTFTLSERESCALNQLLPSIPEEARPEWGTIVLKLFRSCIDLPESQSQLQALGSVIAQGIEHGFHLKRVLELGDWLQKRGISPERSLETLNLVTDAVYGKPKGSDEWWIADNSPLVPKSPLSRGLTEGELNVIEQIAVHSGKSFKTALDLTVNEDFSLLQTPGFSPELAARTYSIIARDYGIHNTARAQRVLSFLFTSLAEEPQEKVLEVTESFLRFSRKNRPESPIVGVLEGSEAAMFLPGIMPLLSTRSATIDPRLSSETFQKQHFLELKEILSKPLTERANSEPALIRGAERSPMLTLSGSAMLALPAPENNVSLSSPLSLSRYMQLNERFSEIDQSKGNHLADLYFSVCAMKLPDPFNPPENLLRALNAIRTVPIEGYREPFFEHPSERSYIRQENAQKHVDKLLVLSDLLDGLNIGAISATQLDHFLTRLTSDLDDAQIREIEVDALWDEYQSLQRAHEAYQSNLAFHDRELQAEIQSELLLQKRTDSAQASQRTRKRIENLLAQRSDLPRSLHESAWGEPPRPEDIAQFSYHEIDTVHLERSVRNKTSTVLLERRREIFAKMTQVADTIHLCHPFIKNGVISGKDTQEIISSVSLNSGMHTPKRAFSYLLHKNYCPEISTALSNLDAHGALDRERLREIVISCMSSPEGDIIPLLTEIKTHESWLSLATSALSKISYLPMNLSIADEDEMKEFIQNQIPASISFSESPQFLDIDGFLTSTLSSLKEKLAEHEEFRQSVQSLVEVQDEICARSGDSAATIGLGMSVGIARVLLGHRTQGHTQRHTEYLSLIAPGAQSSELISIPDIEALIKQCRIRSFGLPPVGGKVHVLHPIDSYRPNLLNEIFKSPISSFRLQHADTTLLLPPLPSAGEMKLLCALLTEHQVIDSEWPEIQQAIPGRLNADACATLGASVLLGTTVGVRYNKKSFTTTHNDQVQFRIMTYDANGPRLDLPFSSLRPGRTDMLGRRSAADFDIYQLVGGVLSSEMDGGEFAGISTWYRSELATILNDYGMGKVLQASWIAQDKWLNDGEAHFVEAISPCTEAYFGCVTRFNDTGQASGIIFDIRDLQAELENRVRKVQSSMLSDPRFEKERKELFGVSEAVYV